MKKEVNYESYSHPNELLPDQNRKEPGHPQRGGPNRVLKLCVLSVLLFGCIALLPAQQIADNAIGLRLGDSDGFNFFK